MAPVQKSGEGLRVYLNDTSVVGLFREFLATHGTFDVVHFNNLEGLPLGVLALRKEFANTKFIYSLHNYYPVCSRVNLWKDEASENEHNCDKKSYDECVNCYQKYKYKSQIERRRADSYSKIPRKLIRGKAKLQEKLYPDIEDATTYRLFEENTINAINKYVDCVLAVSARVKEIAENHGIDKNKLKVSYIGTRIAEHVTNSCICDPHSQSLNVIYMGYMRKDKGFFFFLDAMEHMPVEMARDMTIRVVARYDNEINKNEIDRLSRLKTKFSTLELINGYTPQNQRELLKDMNLGIVPVLWEDNLPQVAIEQIANGVPIVVSDRGGAQEIVNNRYFVFKAGNIEDFIDKLSEIQKNRQKLVDFWKTNRHLVTMQEHVDELMKVYTYEE